MTARLTDRLSASVVSRLHSADSEEGMTTAEYAVGTVAACGGAGLLVELLKSQMVQNLLKEAIKKAFSFFGF